MNVSAFELLLIAVVCVFTIVLHIILAMVFRTNSLWRRRALFIWGWPVCFIGAAVVTPPDIISMLVLGVPVCGVYCVIAGVWLFLQMRATGQ